ncbi:hypothetical protein BDR03DRAFT_959192 [Suillus americanus]|nr:hypothetical protein BDR03DRAFT_959192 [Suillus americanus]
MSQVQGFAARFSVVFYPKITFWASWKAGRREAVQDVPLPVSADRKAEPPYVGHGVIISA